MGDITIVYEVYKQTYKWYYYIYIYTYIVKLTRAPKEGTPMTGRKSQSFLWVIMFPNKPGISQVRLIQMNNRAITGCVS